MAVHYSVVQKIKPGDPSAPRKWYAVAQTQGEIDLRELSTRISEISTVSSIDTLAVLESLIKVIPSELLAGRIVRLGDFGTLRLTLSSEGAETEDAFTKGNIKKVKLIFRPGKTISSELKTVDFHKG